MPDLQTSELSAMLLIVSASAAMPLAFRILSRSSNVGIESASELATQLYVTLSSARILAKMPK